jgi:hypothetical protein
MELVLKFLIQIPTLTYSQQKKFMFLYFQKNNTTWFQNPSPKPQTLVEMNSWILHFLQFHPIPLSTFLGLVIQIFVMLQQLETHTPLHQIRFTKWFGWCSDVQVWNFFLTTSDNWFQNAPTKISEATADINNRFSTIGIQFVSSISYYDCYYIDAGVTKNYTIFPQAGTESPASAVFRERGT